MNTRFLQQARVTYMASASWLLLTWSTFLSCSLSCTTVLQTTTSALNFDYDFVLPHKTKQSSYDVAGLSTVKYSIVALLSRYFDTFSYTARRYQTELIFLFNSREADIIFLVYVSLLVYLNLQLPLAYVSAHTYMCR